MARKAMEKSVFVRMPTDLFQKLEQIADTMELGISTVARHLIYEGLDVDKRLQDLADLNEIFKKYPDAWKQIPSGKRELLKERCRTLTNIRTLADNKVIR